MTTAQHFFAVAFAHDIPNWIFAVMYAACYVIGHFRGWMSHDEKNN